MTMEEVEDFWHPLALPDEVDAAEWARARSAGEPELVPAGWPASSLMALVVVFRTIDGSDVTKAYVLTRPEAMHAVADRQSYPQLWFTLPRALFTPDLAPDLKPEHWPPEGT